MPISFTCPHCGKQTEVDDQFAGQSGPCANCGETVSIPSSSVPGVNAGTPAAAPPRKSGMSVLAIVLVAFLGAFIVCGGVLALLLFPAVESAREAARRAKCTNNMKLIGLAMHNYLDRSGDRFPPAHKVDEDGNPMHSWRVLILPELDRQDLYDRYNFDEPWNSPANQELADEMPDVFACPSAGEGNTGQTSYVMIVGPETISGVPRGTRLSRIMDGTSNTIMLVEVAGRKFNWLEPVDLKADDISYQINDGSENGISSDHPGVANVLFCDGSVHCLPDSISPTEVKAMTTINGREAVNIFDY